MSTSNILTRTIGEYDIQLFKQTSDSNDIRSLSFNSDNVQVLKNYISENAEHINHVEIRKTLALYFDKLFEDDELLSSLNNVSTIDKETIKLILLCIKSFKTNLQNITDSFTIDRIIWAYFPKKKWASPKWHQNNIGSTHRVNIYIDTKNYNKFDLILSENPNKTLAKSRYIQFDTLTTNTILWDDSLVLHRTPCNITSEGFPRIFIILAISDLKFKDTLFTTNTFEQYSSANVLTMGAFENNSCPCTISGGYKKLGIYQSGPKKGKLKKGYYYIKGGAIKKI